MADPSTYRPAAGEIPTSPGVYRFLDPEGRVIYVGKAKNLRARLSNYFQDLAALHPRTQKMVTTACAVEWTVVATEVESLALEYSWIKEFNPRFNVMYKDDKSYPYLMISLGEEFPRAQVVRGARKRGARYFGPYVQAWSIRDTLDQLLRVFPVRSCSAGVFRRAKAAGRPCLLGYIDKCSAPCVGRISAPDHRALAEDLCSFLAGRTGPYLREVESQMRAAAGALDFEKAARLRDDAAALRKVIERNAVVLPDATDADVFGLVRDELTAAVQVFHVRGGRIRGQRGWVIDTPDDATDADLIERLIQQVYADLLDPGDTGAPETSPPEPAAPTTAPVSGPTTSVGVTGRALASPAPRARREDEPTPRRAEAAATSVDDVAHTSTTAVPREVLVPVLPDDAPAVRAWLAGLRGAAVDLRVPARGDKAALMGTVRKNAEEALRLHKTRRAGDLTQRSAALDELAEALDMPEAPLRIECYDISHTQGTHQVGSMVVFEDGAPRKSDYRRFIIRGEDGGGATDDTAAMSEVLTRRFKRLLAEQGRGTDELSAAEAAEQIEDVEGVAVASGPIDPETGRAKRFSYAPGLVVVDGGLPQVGAARAVLDELGIDIPIVGLAKRLEEIWVPGDDFPVILPRTSPALYLLQHLRDESHRFAITHHRAKRSASMTRSVLDDVPGLGPARQAALLKAFGSVKRLRAASVEQIGQVKGIGPALAATIHEHLGGRGEPAG
ncbi:excinuclease ABC subunit C [Actinomyces sp. Chiba101]|uniref:UvrABC system protein C n=1 Tax=Actinomyces denticolens TaxID=52767 RepID=A0ABY1I5F7_9ACTO|nr:MULTISPECIES: excinuclease ABC subunit UvrC [Actinomyces]BAW93054.1 excinuclease ABC subunit C [Actinomyces sp. Chiba101]GAV95719.1 excinuclease ABC subunit C, UvrC [Actinomyces denticolens]SHI62619.1 Excinuclease ABC subunit C [Actinomyces denticolens]SUU05330.1 Excinuclease ABC subunit C [Actinomyces denticolens]